MPTGQRQLPGRVSCPFAAMRTVVLLTLLVMAVASLLSFSARAAFVDNLYVVRVPAEADASRAQIEQAAMSTLLIRVTGRTDAPFDPQLQPLVRGAGDFVDSYGLIDRERYEIGFNATALQRELTGLRYPVWGPERPLTLVLVAIDGGLGEREILASADPVTQRSEGLLETMQELRRQLAATAEQRGLPLALPLMDLEDLIAIDFADVWGGFGERLGEIGQRYQADALLVGRAWAGDSGTEVQWTLFRNGQRHFIDGNGLTAGLDWTANLYAGEFSTVGVGGMTRIVVEGVRSLQDYGRVMRHLEGSSSLDAVDVESYERGTLRLRVHARGDMQTLQRVLTLGGVLSAASRSGAAGADGLTFQVAGQASGR